MFFSSCSQRLCSSQSQVHQTTRKTTRFIIKSTRSLLCLSLHSECQEVDNTRGESVRKCNRDKCFWGLKVSLCFYRPCAGGRGGGGCGPVSLSLGRSAASTLSVPFILGSFRPSVNPQTVQDFQQTPRPPLKNPVWILPPRMPGDLYPWQQPMSAEWGETMFLFCLMFF